MDDRLRICLWLVGGGIFGGVLGGVFGAVAAAMYAWSGGAAGSQLARNVVDHFLQSGQRQPSPTVRAALIGTTDGFFFMGCFGLIAGALLGLTGRPAGELLVPALVGSVVLVGGALFFGTLAYALTRKYGSVALLSTLAGVFVAQAITGELGSVYRVACGVLGCFFAGLLFINTARLYSPKYHPPRIDKTMLQPRPDMDTDITGSPSSLSNDDFFHKPDSFEER